MNHSTSGPKILYFVGRGRSGSTLMGQVLGLQPGVVNTGELKNFREYHLTMDRKQRICADGQVLNTHPFWLKVRTALKENSSEEFPDLKASNQEIFNRNNEAIFQAIRESSGAEIIVDISKKYDRLQQLLRWKNISIFVIHLVRDPRAYVYSTTKRTKKPIERWLGIPRKIFDWNFKNIYLWIYISLKSKNHMTVRYEDFCREPEHTISQILQFAGSGNEQVIIDSERTENPAFSGNMRFFRNTGGIKFDDSYLKNMSAKDWLLNTVFSFPGNLIFGYPLSRQVPGKKEKPDVKREDY